jgi:hypothetical protein
VVIQLLDNQDSHHGHDNSAGSDVGRRQNRVVGGRSAEAYVPPVVHTISNNPINDTSL